jgi:hypothetical protein
MSRFRDMGLKSQRKINCDRMQSRASPQTRSTRQHQPEKSRFPLARSHRAHPPPDAAETHAIHKPAPLPLPAPIDAPVSMHRVATTPTPPATSRGPALATPLQRPIPTPAEQTAPPTQTTAPQNPRSMVKAHSPSSRIAGSRESQTPPPQALQPPPPRR